MDEKTANFPVQRISENDERAIDYAVAREYPLTIVMNGEEMVTLLCTPADMNYLAIGFLASEGLIDSLAEIKRIIVDAARGVVRVDTAGDSAPEKGLLFKRIISSGCGRGASFYKAADAATPRVETNARISSDEVFALVSKFQHASQLYLATHGVHSAGLCDNKDILVFEEDIGRHNAIDKIFGKCLLEGIETAGRIIITSGRITSEILHKAAKRGVPIVISISAPTDLGVNLADTLGITLIASVRGNKMLICSNGERVVRSAKH